jgi:hypothetical protein
MGPLNSHLTVTAGANLTAVYKARFAREILSILLCTELLAFENAVTQERQAE